MSNHKLLLITIVTLLIAAPCTAQYSFTNYDYTHGLPLDEINVIKEDSSGYLWLGGPMGLARFDGQKFKSFDQGDLPGDIVSDIDITPSGRVVASFVDQGIAIYDPKTETIVSRIYREEDGLNFPQYHIYSTYIQNDTTAILCGTEEDIYQLNLISLESKLLIESNRPREIIEDPIIDDCYLFTANGLHRYCSDDETPTKLSKNGFYGLKVIGDELWFNNYFGKVIRYNLVTGASRSYTTIDNGVIRGWTIVGENVWIGMHYGVVVIDLSSGDIQTVLN